MKRALIVAAAILASVTFSAGGTNGKQALQGGPGINNGLYLHLGFALPAFTARGTTQGMGFEPNFEWGHQWYFAKTDKFGFGLKISWIQAGFSTFQREIPYATAGLFGNPVYTTTTVATTNIDLRFLKVAPQVTFAVAGKAVLDVYVEAAPTLMIGASSNNSYIAYGVLFAPGARFRINKFAVGFDASVGRLSFEEENVSGVSANNGIISSNYKGTVFIPRVYVGLKF